MWALVIVFYIVYSVFGFKLLSDYSVKCIRNKTLIFDGSILVTGIMAFILGIFTTFIFLWSMARVLFSKNDENDVDSNK